MNHFTLKYIYISKKLLSIRMLVIITKDQRLDEESDFFFFRENKGKPRIARRQLAYIYMVSNI